MTQPLFTIVIPVHNKAPHLERCLGSVFGQTCQDFEVVAVDDASTDGSAERLARVDDDRFRLLSRETPGKGGYAARNLAIEQARGRWVAFMDADDSWRPDHLTGLKAAMGTDDGSIAMVASGHMILGLGVPVEDRVSRRLPSGDRKLIDLDFPAFLSLWLQIGECPVWTSAIAVRQQTVRAIGGFPAARCVRGGDKDTWLRMAAQGRVVISPQPTANYHMDASNMVTRTAPLCLPHCLEASALALQQSMAATSSGKPEAAAAARLLRQLIAHERFSYVLETARRGTTPPFSLLRTAGLPKPGNALRLAAILLRNRLGRNSRMAA